MKELFRFLNDRILQFAFAIWGAVCASFAKVFPFAIVCTLLILADCVTAWGLSRRVKEKHPGLSTGKFKSQEMGRVFISLIKTYAALLLAQLVESTIFEGAPIRLVNIVAGAVCFWQVWSILENESSCNDADWAKILQKIMVDKTERHFDIDLSDLKELSGKKNDKMTGGDGDDKPKSSKQRKDENQS